MSDSEVCSVVDKIIRELNPLYVTFSGGEPFIRKKLLFSCIKKLKAQGIAVHINTNGLLIDEKSAKTLHTLQVDKVNINLESLDKKKHDFLRGKDGAFSQLISNIALLKKYVGSNHISIATVVTRENIDSLLDIARFVKEQRFMEFHLLDMIPTNANERRFMPSKEDWLRFYKIFQDILALNIPIKPNHALLFMEHFKKKNIPIPFCMAGRLKMVICADGTIVPCDFFKSKSFVCGNAIKDNLLTVWQKSPVMNKFRYSLEGYESCQSCGAFSKCGGGCKALSYGFYGNAFMPDPYCKSYGFRYA